MFAIGRGERARTTRSRAIYFSYNCTLHFQVSSFMMGNDDMGQVRGTKINKTLTGSHSDSTLWILTRLPWTGGGRTGACRMAY